MICKARRPTRGNDEKSNQASVTERGKILNAIRLSVRIPGTWPLEPARFPRQKVSDFAMSVFAVSKGEFMECEVPSRESALEGRIQLSPALSALGQEANTCRVPEGRPAFERDHVVPLRGDRPLTPLFDLLGHPSRNRRNHL